MEAAESNAPCYKKKWVPHCWLSAAAVLTLPPTQKKTLTLRILSGVGPPLPSERVGAR